MLITFKNTAAIENSISWQMAENYLNFGQYQCKFSRKNPTTHHFKLKRSDTSIPFFVLKGLTLFTLIIPIVALCIRHHYRKKHKFQCLRGEVFCKSLRAAQKVFRSSPPLLYKSHENHEANRLTPAQLRIALSSIQAYISNQSRLISTIQYALKKIDEPDVSPEEVQFAKNLLRETASFLRNFTSKKNRLDVIKKYKNYLNHSNAWETRYSHERPSNYMTEHFSVSEACQKNHIAICHLVENLRRSLKLSHSKKSNPPIAASSSTEATAYELFRKIRWLHGTKAIALDLACKNSNRKLIPSGELQKKKIAPFSGENRGGISKIGINASCLSGVSSLNAQIALDYANLKESEKISEEGRCNAFIASIDKSDLDYYIEELSVIPRITIALNRLKQQNPESYNEIKKRMLEQLPVLEEKEKTYLEQNRSKSYSDDDGYYNFAANLNDLKLALAEEPASAPRLPPVDDRYANIGIVVASSTQYGILGYPHMYAGSITTNEEVIPNAMEFGKDLQYVFTASENMSAVRELVAHHGLSDTVSVHSFDTLQQIQKIARENKRRLSDIYNLEKWKKSDKSIGLENPI